MTDFVSHAREMFFSYVTNPIALSLKESKRDADRKMRKGSYADLIHKKCQAIVICLWR